jgi:hypothetical protein
VYRVFALLAFGATLLVGTPIGIWMLGWRYLGLDAVPAGWVWLHGSVQIWGFFGALIPGISEHLFARFTGRPVAGGAQPQILAALLGSALALRVIGVWVDSAGTLLIAGGLQSAALFMFTWRVWRALDPPPLAPLRRHLTASTAWLAVGSLIEAATHAPALMSATAGPEWLDVAYTMALVGGITGWVLGVLLRAGPMFVARWNAPAYLARALPWALAAAVLVHAAGRLLVPGPMAAAALAAAGDSLACWTAVAVLVGAGVLRRAPLSLPMVARSQEESRIFRVAVAAIIAGAVISTAGLALTMLTGSDALAADAARHLLTVGLLASTVLAMTFRLVPVLEGQALPWPACRPVARWALAGAVTLRTLEVPVSFGAAWLAPAVALSGPLVWAALACGGATVMRAASRWPRGGRLG